MRRASALDAPLDLIVGLGNPGPQYDRTRHNAGADFVNALAQRFGVTLKQESKFSGFTARLTIGGRAVRLLIPSTFMNHSGRAVAPLAQFYGLAVRNILVVHDELDLPPGTARLKIGGGHGGHNGLRDIISALGNQRDFARLRIGIGHPGQADDVVAYVLRKAPHEEQLLIDTSIDNAIAALPDAVSGNWNSAMKALHTNGTAI